MSQARPCEHCGTMIDSDGYDRDIIGLEWYHDELRCTIAQRDVLRAQLAEATGLLERWLSRGFPMGGVDVYDATKSFLGPERVLRVWPNDPDARAALEKLRGKL